MARRSFDKDSSKLQVFGTQLEAAAQDRNRDVGVAPEISTVHMLFESLEAVPDDLPASFKDLAGYYRGRQGHKNAHRIPTSPARARRLVLIHSRTMI